jgi:anti-sigma regulatory factor (Ser/Thr protein kinase)
VTIEGARAMVAVSDSGSGFRPPAHPTMPSPLATGHRGLPLMQALVDRVDVASHGHGTTVVLVQALTADSRRAALVDS